MPTLDLSQDLLSANANFKAGDWADAGASASLKLKAVGELKRGINLELGVGAAIELEANFHKFLAAGAQGKAFASAHVKAQIQQPLDLFGEAGAAARLEAAAKAGVGIRLGIGLSIGDFIALAQQDPRIAGVPEKLLIIFLEELEVQAGVTAQAAVSAMAFGKLAITGRLIDSDNEKAGFTIAGEYGVGWKGGTGWQLYGRFGIKDPSRLIRRSVDVVVDESLIEIARHLPENIPETISSTVLKEIRMPAKIAFRIGFELGYELATNPNVFDPDTAPDVAMRCVQVILEEAQRYLLDRFSSLGTSLFFKSLEAIGVSKAEWQAAQPQFDHLADVMERMPDDPFEPDPVNLVYFTDLFNAFLDVGIALHDEDIDAKWAEPITIVWSAYQLMFASVKRISSVSARASILGLDIGEAHAAFTGDLLDGTQAPPVIHRYLNNHFGRTANTPITQDDLLDFLLQDRLLVELLVLFPDAKPVVEIVGGPRAEALTEAAKTIFRNIGSFAPGADGKPDANASLKALLLGLQTYLHTRIDGELVPYLHQHLTDQPELRLYVDDVILNTLRFSINTVLQQVVDWHAGDITTKTAVREACSSIMMKLIGRSLVVSTDILSTKALEFMTRELDRAADHVNDPEGIAESLARITGHDRETVAELCEETLRIAAEVFKPLPDNTRSKIRGLLYDMVDTLPAGAEGDFVEQLKHDVFIPDYDTALELANELGNITLSNLRKFTNKVLSRVAELVIEDLSELVDDIEENVRIWLAEVNDLLEQLAARINEIQGEIVALITAIQNYQEELVDKVTALLQFYLNPALRNDIMQQAKALLLSDALGALSGKAEYTMLPKAGRKVVEDALNAALDVLVNNTVSSQVSQAFAGLAQDYSELLTGINELPAGSNLVSASTDLFLDRVEQALRAQFDFLDPGFAFSFQVNAEYKPAPIKTCVPFTTQCSEIQPPNVALNFTLNLGSLSLSLDTFVAEVRKQLRASNLVIDRINAIANSLVNLANSQVELQAANLEQSLLVEEQATAQNITAQASLANANITIESPESAGFYDKDLRIRLRLDSVPESFYVERAQQIQRLHVWINQLPLPVGQFEIKTVDEKQLTKTNMINHQRGREREVTGQVIRVNRRDRSGKSPGIFETENSGNSLMRLETVVPHAALEPGINTLSIALVDGAGRRFEQAISFVVGAAEKPSTRAPVLPPRPEWKLKDKARVSWANANSNLARQLVNQAGNKILEPSITFRSAIKNEKNLFWIAGRSERKARIKAGKKQVQQQVKLTSTTLAKLASSIKRGDLRPVDSVGKTHASQVKQKS